MPRHHPRPHAPAGTQDLVGTAVDYRVRRLWPHGTATDLVGVGIGAYSTFSRERADRFAVEVDELTGRHAAPGSWDNPEANEQPGRLALVVGQLEAAWRSKLPLDAASGIHPTADLTTMLAAQRDDLVTDICNIVNTGRTHLAPLLGLDVNLNPVFEQGPLVGGADADFVAGGCPVELKTTTRPSMPSNEVRQLVTYALLDNIDEHHIRHVALFYIRRPQYLSWNLEELLDVAGATANRAERSASLIIAFGGGTSPTAPRLF